ncbi:MAG TPA: hypothetical protein VEC01_08525 [Noviherbaspirillum sp.]|uniref:hypothetical protein n=1 Tax=Noviherbaspirillum sp. TaxID=1926288 RepID=UPI002D6C8BC2|nr:hypothetical protein [Noviherbaspirillum sp.]HYD95357.1 hypothetical protein [Noviherbaspirillum sp.]
MNDLTARQQFEAWAATRDLDLKPGRCSFGQFQHAEHDADLAWEAWKYQQAKIDALQRQLDEAKTVMERACAAWQDNAALETSIRSLRDYLLQRPPARG